MNEAPLPETADLTVVVNRQRAVLEQETLPDWLQRMRWFAGKNRVLERVKIGGQVALNVPGMQAAAVVLDACYRDGSSEQYGVIFALTAAEEAIRLRAHAPQAVLTDGLAGYPGMALVDGIHFPAVAQHLVRIIAERGELQGACGTLTGKPGRALPDLGVYGDLPLPTVLHGQQSNTSVAFGTVVLLKQFRRLTTTNQREAEIGQALTEQAHYSAAAPFAGELRYRAADGREQTLAFLQGFVPHRENGWEYALTTARAYCARLAQRMNGKLPSQEQVLRELTVPGWVAFTEVLGAQTAALHGALAGVAGAAFAPETGNGERWREQSSEVLADQEQLRHVLRGGSWDAEAASHAAAVMAEERTWRQQLIDLAVTLPSAPRIRIHGDFHLGQVLCTGTSVAIIDFAAEPARAMVGERKQTPLYDVAGMLRSFHYAAEVAWRAWRPHDPVIKKRIRPWMAAWAARSGMSFLHAYVADQGVTALLPADPAACRRLLAWCLYRKVMYEIAYELESRPDWVAVPLADLRAMLERYPAVLAQPPDSDAWWDGLA